MPIWVLIVAMCWSVDPESEACPQQQVAETKSQAACEMLLKNTQAIYPAFVARCVLRRDV